MSGNRIVVYQGRAVETVDYPKLEVPAEVACAMSMTRNAEHGVILKCVSTVTAWCWPPDRYGHRGGSGCAVLTCSGGPAEDGNGVAARPKPAQVPLSESNLRVRWADVADAWLVR